jgi:hypothetical protein
MKMSRSGYSDDYDDVSNLNLYRGSVDRAFAGKRCQRFLSEMAAVMDAMPIKVLASSEWIKGGNACALGCVAQAKGLGEEFSKLDPEDYDAPAYAAYMLNIATSMAREIVYINDEGSFKEETDEGRWLRMRQWIQSHILPRPTP